jgi:pyruvate/2-oxoglutarate dehydrogenase complex dihydrolipoamide acyltransferase (E2) component
VSDGARPGTWWHRRDAKLVRGEAAYRRVMPYLMRGRNESAVYFEQRIDLERLEPFLAGSTRPLTPFPVVVWALVRTIAEFPDLNRFVAGGRLYQRDGIWVTYVAKQELVEHSPLVTVKRSFDPTEPFAEMVAAIDAQLRAARADHEGTTDREVRALLHLPGVARRAALRAERFADALGVLPRAYVDNDPMYATVFIANLGSIGLDAAYHHLYEYGNVGIFCVIGRTHTVPVATDDGQVAARRVLPIRFTYDERMQDGMYAAHALERFRLLAEDPAAAGACTP